jgi:hypothetical protein
VKLVYVAGPIDNPNPEKVKENIERACKEAAWFWQKGFSVICPHANTKNVEDYCSLDRDQWIDGDLEQVRRCDAIYLCEGWEESEGCKKELKEAIENGLQIIPHRRKNTYLFNIVFDLVEEKEEKKAND